MVVDPWVPEGGFNLGDEEDMDEEAREDEEDEGEGDEVQRERDEEGDQCYHIKFIYAFK